MLDEARVLVAIAGLEDQQRPVDIADLALAAELSVSETELILRVLERRGFVGTAGDHPPRLTFAGFRELDDVRAELDLDRSARQAADRPREMEYVSSGHDLTAGQWDVIHGVDRASSNGSVVWVHGPAASGKSTAAVDLAADSMEDVFVDVSHAAPDGDLAELADQYYEPDEWVSWWGFPRVIVDGLDGRSPAEIHQVVRNVQDVFGGWPLVLVARDAPPASLELTKVFRLDFDPAVLGTRLSERELETLQALASDYGSDPDRVIPALAAGFSARTVRSMLTAGCDSQLWVPPPGVITELDSVEVDVLKTLAHDPARLHDLTAEDYEHVVARVLAQLGYEVSLTRASGDGGVDVYARLPTAFGEDVFLIQCKRYAPHRPVGVNAVRELNGLVEHHRANAGVLVTTSYFTRGARLLAAQLAPRMRLRDFLEMHKWLTDVTP